MSDFNTAIRAQEGKVTVAKDNLKMYESQRGTFEKKFEEENPRYREVKVKVREWRDEVNLAVRVLQTMREVAGRPADAPIVRAAPEPIGRGQEGPVARLVQEVIAKEAPAPKPESPFPQTANGFDLSAKRLHWKHQAILWNIEHYPLPTLYKSRSAMFIQALRTLVRQHRDYPKWLAGGGISMSDARGGANRPDVVAAADYLKIDTWALDREVTTIHAEIMAYGVSGEDRQW